MFNPFGKKFTELTEDDLQILRKVSEGWYIEYKSIIPEAKKIAKSVASFGNSYGGLYILGIEADKNNCAINFPGVDIKLDIIHDAVKGNINPFPYFDCYTIGLKNGKSIIIITVEEGFEPPYIHNDGRIYRRQESSSDPIPETNRYSLDQLYNKSQEHKEKLENFRTIDYGICKGEENWSYLNGYINTKQLERTIITDLHTFDFQKKIINLFNEEFNIDEAAVGQINGRMLFNNVTAFNNSIIIRNISNIAYNTLTIELFSNGCMKFMLPITVRPISNSRSYSRILEYCRKHNIDDDDLKLIKWVPISNLCTELIGVFIKYFKFLKEYDCFDDIEFVFEGQNIWRVCLFSDEEEYFDYIQEYSLPIVIKDNIVYPEKPYQIIFSNETDTINKDNSFIMGILGILGMALSGFGIPSAKSVVLFTSESKNRRKYNVSYSSST
jgi:hypothetical protein